MDASILVVGGPDFSEYLLEQICQIQGITTEVAANATEATPLIQAQQPDLVILQAKQDNLQLCHAIKEQKSLSWIYCILVDNLVQPGLSSTLELESELELRTASLEGGADAYLQLSSVEQSQAKVLREQQRLLRAQVQAGLRMVMNHRELMRTNDILSAIALSDPLTNLNNRRALDWELPRQIQNARNRSEPLSLLMLDVDYFKSINDTYGHPIGDRALQLLSSRLRHNLRFHDTLFRYGGEEFVIILSKTDRQEAALVARRLCKLISSQPFTIDDQRDLNITISAGTATLETEDDAKGASLLARADGNLLRAKSSGRNRVITCEDVIAEGTDKILSES